MQDQESKFFSFPLPVETHKQLRIVATIKGLTFRDLFARLADEYLRKEENQKILIGLK